MKKQILALTLSLAALLSVPSAFAARTALTVKTPKDVNSATFAANSADVTFTAADTSNKNSFVSTGKEILMVQNSGGSDYTLTITSAPDELGRVKDVDSYTLSTTEFACFGPIQQRGWKQADGKVYLEGSNAAIKFLVIRVP